VMELREPECLPSLRCLDISNQMIGDAGLHALAHSSRFGSLRKLILKHQGISDEGLKAMAASPCPGRLQELNLVWNPFGDAGLEALCQSELARGIRTLALSGTPNAGTLLANSCFENLIELRVERVDSSLLEPLATSESLNSLRRLIFHAGTPPADLLKRE